MARNLTVDGTTYAYPDPGEDPGWGEAGSDWAEAVTGVLNSLLSPGDLLETTFNVANNISVATNITGLAFNTGVVRSALITYSIYRISTSTPSGKAETGQLNIVYDNSASSGNKWLLTQEATGNSGVTFDITDLGQFTYTSTDIGTPGYSGIMKFSAKVQAQ